MNQANRIFVRLTTGYLCLLPTLFLFFCGTDGYQRFLSAKFSVFYALCGGYVLLMGVLGLECVLVGGAKFPSLLVLGRRSSWTQRFVLAYLAFTWISALLSPYAPETILGVSRYEGALTITIYGLSFLLVSVFARVTPRMLAISGTAAALFGGLCLLQFAGWNPFHLYPAGYGYVDAYTAYAGAYLGTIGNVDLVAAFLCVAIPVLWVGVVRLRGKRRFLLLIPLAVLMVVLLKISVLAGLVGVLGGGILMLPVVLPLPPKRRMAAVGALALAAVVSTAFVYWYDVPSGLFHEVHAILHGNWDDTFGSGRIYIWKAVLQRVPQQLCFGSGPDTMLYAEIEPFTRYDGTLDRLIVSQIDMAHNEYLNILFHQGIFALAAYLLALASAAWGWVKHSAADPVCAMMGGGVLCYCIQAFFGFSTCITAPFFWAALGLLENRTTRGNLPCGKN